jgi:capsular polysaccharide biosynthesis protein
MEQLKQGNDMFELTALLKRIWRWRLILIVVGAVAFGTSFLVVKLISPLYESHAILYPTISSNRQKQLEEFAFGFDVHSERLMQLLAADAIMDSLNKRYNLVDHYGIDQQNVAWYDIFIRKAHQRIQTHKTRFTSVVISVLDEDPKLAAQIANDMCDLVNGVNAEIVKTNAKEAMQAVEEEYEKRLGMVQATNDSIFHILEGTASFAQNRLAIQVADKRKTIGRIRKELGEIRQEFNIYDFAHQINVLNDELASARANYLQESGRLEVYHESKLQVPDSMVLTASAAQKGAESRMTQFEAELKSLSKTGARYNVLNAQLDEETALLQETLAKLEGMLNSVEPQIETRRIESLERNYDWDQLQTLELKRKYQEALSNYVDPAPVAYLISHARPSYIKVFPNTMLSVLLATMGALLMAMVILLFAEKLREGGEK